MVGSFILHTHVLSLSHTHRQYFIRNAGACAVAREQTSPLFVLVTLLQARHVTCCYNKPPGVLTDVCFEPRFSDTLSLRVL